MCGVSGFSNIKDPINRFNLVLGLSLGIDSRGGDAAGYVSISSGKLKYAKRIGTWSGAKMKFLEGAARSDLCMMHARFATCGDNDMASVHPYTIRRNDKVVLWGAHNGIIPDAWDVAKMHGRECIVDSKELFELIADKEYDTIQQMDGYGVATWVEASDLSKVKIVRLSEYSDLCVVRVSDGGIVWGSTWAIISEALQATNLTAESEFKLDEIGRVYEIRKDNVYQSNVTGLKLSENWYSSLFKEFRVQGFDEEGKEIKDNAIEADELTDSLYWDDCLPNDDWNPIMDDEYRYTGRSFDEKRFLTRGM